MSIATFVFFAYTMCLNGALLSAKPAGDEAAIRRFADAIELLIEDDRIEKSFGNTPYLVFADLRPPGSPVSHYVSLHRESGRVKNFSSIRQRSRGNSRARHVELTLNTEEQVRAKAQRLLADLGLDREFEIEEVRLDPEEVSTNDPTRMKSFGTAHVQGRKKGDPISMHGRNRWTVAFDRWDGAVLYYGLVDNLRFIEEPDTIGEAGARRATEGIWGLIDADDPAQYPAEWRRVSAVEKGWSSVGKQWHDAYKAQHGRKPEFGAIVPAYKVYFSNSPWWPGQDEPDWVIVRAFNGEVMHDARY